MILHIIDDASPNIIPNIGPSNASGTGTIICEALSLDDVSDSACFVFVFFIVCTASSMNRHFCVFELYIY